MCIRAGIDDDAGAIGRVISETVYAVDYFSLGIALEIFNGSFGEFASKGGEAILKSGFAIYFGLSSSEKIQVRSVDYADHGCLSVGDVISI